MREFTEEELKRVYGLIELSDEDFYEQFLADASLEELAAFLEEFPDFMEDGEMYEVDAEKILQKILSQTSSI